MKKFLIAAAGVVVFAAPALAADMAPRYTKAPPMVAPPVYDWSGFYVGVNGGGGSSRDCWSLTNLFGVAVNPSASEGCQNATGGTVGGQVGYRWQASSWVFGLEAQGNWADFKGSNANTLVPAFIADQTKVDAFGLFTGQVGYAVNNVLFYAKGGAAVTDNKYNNLILVAAGPFAAGQAFSQGTDTRWGGVAGVGIEFGFAPNWSVAVEYDHLFMGNASVVFPPTNIAVGRTDTIGQDVDMGTVRLNYRFGGPVIAKY